MKQQYKRICKDIAVVATGSVLYAMSMNQFLIPGGIVLGGASGLGVALHALCGINVSLVILLFNLPLVAFNMHLYGIKFCLKTAIGVLSTSAALELLQFFPITTTDPLLCTIFGSVCMGVGCGLMFTRGYTTGGTDLIAWTIRYFFRRIPTGRLISLCDLLIVLLAALARHSYESAFYSLISIYLFGYIVDLMIDGAGKGKLVWIISSQHAEIAAQINSILGRGMTLLDGRGWYSNEQRQLLLCAVRPAELYRMKEIVRACDPDAFMVVCDAHEVIGEGFALPDTQMPSGQKRPKKQNSAVR